MQPRIAYFCMEMALDPAMPTYSGGLGVLAGDMLRAAADADVPMVGVSLVYRQGYPRQRLDAQGNQVESPAEWSPERLLEPLEAQARISIEGRPVQVQAWRYLVRGAGQRVPVYLLDTALPENSPWDRTLTDHLYGGDERYRLCQEVVLGMGGLALLRAQGHQGIEVFHLNEGHSALVCLALLAEPAGEHVGRPEAAAAAEAVRRQCVFTTHTPVAAGHDRFPAALVRRVLGGESVRLLEGASCWEAGALNMTRLALSFARYANGVSARHQQVCEGMFPEYPIHAITNGVHATTWTAEPFQRLYDRHLPGWRQNNTLLRHAVGIPPAQVRRAHAQTKQGLLREVAARTGVRLDAQALTVGFARRATAYKRMHLFFADLERLRRIARAAGPLQVICSGKAHPRDEAGKELIRRVYQAASEASAEIPVVYLEDYDLALARRICSGVDLWLNTPERPHEASGTSGMKAALNGVPSLSVLDGWWVEGHVEGITGWSIGGPSDAAASPPAQASIRDPQSNIPGPADELASLYDKLERVILPLYYHDPASWAEVMRSAISLNGSYFTAQRMLGQYVAHAYLADEPHARSPLPLGEG